jgi:predicted molibdopterin-dependent oxidoreductase YjgC
MTRRTANLELVGVELLEINAGDALDHGIADGERVRVASRRGAIEVTARVSDRISPGEAFTAFHFPEALTNRLTSQEVDEVTSCPEYKVTAVRIERAA